MDERWQRIERLFRQAADLSPAERTELLDRECFGDRALRRELEELLELDAPEDASLIDAVDDAARGTLGSGAGGRIGPYRLVRELGHGGMGTVFLAERDDDAFRKQVAIKLMRIGVRHPDLQRRFRTERQVLATLEHPYIARLLDGGTTPNGEPYVVMEYVEGGTIVEHCQQRGPSPRQRLELFCKVCQAVHYAHEHGVVHRDIKPGNVIINAEGDPRLLDFGIAKLVDPDLIGESTEETRAGLRLMTPQYASPEQVYGESATAATDVYSLGVLLYELIVDRRPYRVEATDPLTLERAICETEPERPSRVRRGVPRDLDVIVGKAMRKEPEARYASAGELGTDVQRHLDGLPIQARPTTIAYRVSKFVRRRPAAAALIATLVLAIPVTSWLGVREYGRQLAIEAHGTEEMRKELSWLAERLRHDEVRTLAEKLLKRSPGDAEALRHLSLASFGIAGLTQEGERRTELERQALANVDRLIAEHPDLAWPLSLKAYMLDELGQPEQAAELAASAERLRPDEPSEEDLTFAARLALQREEYEEALALLTRLIDRHPDRPAAIAYRGFVHEQLGDLETAYRDYRIALGIDPEQRRTQVDLARLSIVRGDLDDAGRYLNSSLGPDQESAFALETQGDYLRRRGLDFETAGDRATAERYYRDAEDASRRALALHPELIWPRSNIAASLVARYGVMGSPDATLLALALELYDELLLRWDQPPTRRGELEVYGATLSNRCDVLIRLDRLRDAVDTCQRVTQQFPTEPNGFYNLAGAHALLGNADEALAALEIDHELGDDDWQYLLQDPWFEALREHPRFLGLVASMQAP